VKRIVRVEDIAVEAIVKQLRGTDVDPVYFITVDLNRELRFVSEHYESLPTSGLGRRHTQQEPESVTLFHLFAAEATDGIVSVYHIDIWIDEPPKD